MSLDRTKPLLPGSHAWCSDCPWRNDTEWAHTLGYEHTTTKQHLVHVWEAE